MTLSAIVYGHTGAIGKPLLQTVLENNKFSKVTVIGRRSIDYDGPGKEKLVQHVVDFDRLEESKSAFKDHNVAFCSFGTTRKDAGSAEAFKKIDHDYVLNAAKLIHQESGNPEQMHFLYVSSGGANASSPFLYMQSKGQTENDLGAVGFGRLSIFRPGFLEVEEPRKGGNRIAEGILTAIKPAIRWISPKSAMVPVRSVAHAMVQVALSEPKEKLTIYDNSQIIDLSAAYTL
ncbi:hypothetical protein RI367_003800 [Sorochytrium milnesiophthora]